MSNISNMTLFLILSRDSEIDSILSHKLNIIT